MLKITLPPSQNLLLGGLIAVFSLCMLVNRAFFFGVPSLLLAVAITTTYHYIVLDFAAGYKGEFTCLLGFIPLGGWERLPPINHVFLKRFSERIRDEIGDSGVHQIIRQQRYLIMFSVPDSREGFLVVEVLSLPKARDIARKIAVAGGLRLEDYTSGNSSSPE